MKKCFHSKPKLVDLFTAIVKTFVFRRRKITGTMPSRGGAIEPPFELPRPESQPDQAVRPIVTTVDSFRYFIISSSQRLFFFCFPSDVRGLHRNLAGTDRRLRSHTRVFTARTTTSNIEFSKNQ